MPVNPVSGGGGNNSFDLTPIKETNQEIKKLVDGVKENTENTKTISYAALGMSVATLIPLSILALKTGKAANALEEMGKGAKTVTDPLKKASDEVNKFAQKFLTAALELIDKDKATSLVAKINNVEPEKALDAFQKLCETVEKNFSESKPQVVIAELVKGIHEVAQALKTKVSEADAQKITKIVEDFTLKFSKKAD